MKKNHGCCRLLEFSHGEVEQAFQNTAHQLSGAIELGGQNIFILKGKISYAIPQENQSLKVYCSTQHPTGNAVTDLSCIRHEYASGQRGKSPYRVAVLVVKSHSQRSGHVLPLWQHKKLAVRVNYA
ncbi:molybdopterin cofactor-binding domain-containing protein [Acinetobacter baumannii]